MECQETKGVSGQIRTSQSMAQIFGLFMKVNITTCSSKIYLSRLFLYYEDNLTLLDCNAEVLNSKQHITLI